MLNNSKIPDVYGLDELYVLDVPSSFCNILLIVWVVLNKVSVSICIYFERVRSYNWDI